MLFVSTFEPALRTDETQGNVELKSRLNFVISIHLNSNKQKESSDNATG